MTKQDSSTASNKENKKTDVAPSQDLAKTPKSTNPQTIVIAVLSTVLACFLITFVALVCTGAISFGNAETDQSSHRHSSDSGDDDNRDNDGKPDSGHGKSGSKSSSHGKLIDNPNPRVTVNGTLAEVQNLEFYLPYQFEAGGKNKEGAYTYNLVNDDGWAQVLVYVDNSSLTPTQYLSKVSNNLDINDAEYEVNGTSWVEGENGNMLAYATKVDGKNYAVVYAVKLDSDATSEAMQMIPKTLYMKKIPQE